MVTELLAGLAREACFLLVLLAVLGTLDNPFDILCIVGYQR